MATDTITIRLPDELQHRLQRLVALTGQSVDALIAKSLSTTLPQLPDNLAPTTRDALQALENLSNDDLRQWVQATLPEDQYERFSALREERYERPLTASEQAELDRLTEQADLLTLQKAYAAVLLKWRDQAQTHTMNQGV